MKKIIALFLSVAMLLSLGACGSKKELGYAIKYDIKINPEFTMYADETLCVTEITAENDDAQNVLANIDVVGHPVSESLEVITNEAKTQGYMTVDKGNTVDINILEKDDKQMPTCHICGGCGTIICLECNGTGIACSCDRCKGTGYNHFAAGPECWSCHGSGVCPECGGLGKIVVTNGEDGAVVYISDGVPEMGPCPACIGDGICGNCHGGDYSNPEYSEICEGCQGTGYLICHDDLNGYRWCPCCWGSGVEGTGDPGYESWLIENGYSF